jgi:hypothetical protein
MIKQFKGTGPLALRADRLPARPRVGLMLIRAQLALDSLRLSHDFPIAHSAFELARRWYDKDRISPTQIEDALAHEYNKGVVDCELAARSEPELSAWLVIEDTLLYTAFHATKEAGEHPSSLISNVEENIFDDFEGHMRGLSPMTVDFLFQAADLLSHCPHASFAQLKSMIYRSDP